MKGPKKVAPTGKKCSPPANGGPATVLPSTDRLNLTGLLWPCSLGNVTVGVQQQHWHDARRCFVPLRAHFQIFSLCCFSRRFDGDGGRYRFMIKKSRVSSDHLQCPSSSCQRCMWSFDASNVSWQEGILSVGNRYTRVLGLKQRSLPPRKAVNSEFIRSGSVNW